ncbi:MAG TPA: twin-arginine translocase TatA/TatE family subunit [Terriglobales bacterium]
MNLGFPEMIFLFILALIIFGPKRLPEIGRQIGKGLAEFKRASSEFQAQIHDEVRKLELEADLKKTIAPPSVQNTLSPLHNTVAYSPQSSIDSDPETASVEPPTLDGNALTDGAEQSASVETASIPTPEKTISAGAAGDSGNRADA